jgi:sugar-phosphatase
MGTSEPVWWGMETRGVIFDMDGLLIDTEPVWRRVQIEVFGRLGLQLTEGQCAAMMGIRIGQIVEDWYARHRWDGPGPGEVTQEIINGVIAHVLAEGEPNPGVMRTLQDVHAAGLPIGIASSSSDDLIAAVVHRLRIERYVSAVCSADNEKRGKPDPDVYLAAARALHVPPDACVALEDSPNGVVSAKSAGMYCIAVPDPHLAGDPRMATADVTIPSLLDFSLDLLPGVTSAGRLERG